MSAPKLLIRKRMLQIQGRVRPTCFVQALVEPALQSLLETYFPTETLFRRAAYSMSWPVGTITIPPSLTPSLNSFLKNDACPEINVKTLIAGQMYQGANAWEMMTFELIAKVAFDNLLQLIASAAQFDSDVFYAGSKAVAQIEAFVADAFDDAAAGETAPRAAA